MKASKYSRSLVFVVFVGAVGYFVDAYDLWIAALVRGKSLIVLKQLNPTTGDAVASVKAISYSLENWQNAGLLAGILWGALADRFGRKRALYASIALYSLANLANGQLTSNTPYVIEVYKVLRFASGVGLAAELSIAITLVGEVFPKEKRGYGIMIVISFGLLGAALAAALTEFSGLDWNYLYTIGGVLGLILLFFRIGVVDSSVYVSQKASAIARGNVLALFTSWPLFKKLVLCISLGAPTYFIISIPIKFATNYSKYLNGEKISLGITVITFFMALSIGDVAANYLSQKLESRKQVLIGYLIFAVLVVAAFAVIRPRSAFQYHYVFTPLLGLSAGYWTLLLTTVTEQWGTNLRATATTAVPNLIRAMALPIVPMFVFLESRFDTMAATAILGIGSTVIAIIAWFFIAESFHNDLNFVESGN
ncbi:MAG TPA: MFS transporter [Pyrinomonadaceae bacterium]|nr:MFS transporter [Pyrinomonadaceae bacterium]